VLDSIALHALAPSELKRPLVAEREGEPFLAFKDATS
jgi:hypothetical protein